MAYTKQNFKDGEVLSAAQLNAMDGQIEANEASVRQQSAALNAFRAAMQAIVGDPDALETSDKTDLVSAINEVCGKTGGQWRGKSWYAFGTSLTDTDYVNAEDGLPTGKYVPYLARLSGLVPTDCGIAGGTIGKGGIHGGSGNILAKLRSTDLSSADLITIEGFVNDYACAVALGHYGITSTSTSGGTGESVTRFLSDFNATKSKLIDKYNAGAVIDYTANDWYSVTDPITVTEGETLVYSFDNLGTYPAIACYDASGNYVASSSVVNGGDGGVLSTVSGTLTIPSGVSTVRICYCNMRDYSCTFTSTSTSGGTGEAVDDTTTMYGAITAAVKHCLENSDATVVLITESRGRPYTLTSTGQSVDYSTTRKNSLNLTQKDYNDVILDVGRHLGVPVIDAGGRSGINECTPQYLADHIHHSELGGRQYALTVWDELKSIHCRREAEV